MQGQLKMWTDAVTRASQRCKFSVVIREWNINRCTSSTALNYDYIASDVFTSRHCLHAAVTVICRYPRAGVRICPVVCIAVAIHSQGMQLRYLDQLQLRPPRPAADRQQRSSTGSEPGSRRRRSPASPAAVAGVPFWRLRRRRAFRSQIRRRVCRQRPISTTVGRHKVECGICVQH